MRVLIYSPVRFFGEGLAACLEQVPDVSAVRACHLLAGIADEVRRLPADLVLFDVNAKRGLGGARALAATCCDTPIVALALPEAAEEVIACADAGLVSYVPRQASLEQLLTIMHMTLRGEMVCDPKIASGLLRELHRRRGLEAAGASPPLLTCREIEVVRLLRRGMSNKEIANHLNISVATAKNHVHSILGKLSAQRRADVLTIVDERPWLLMSA